MLVLIWFHSLTPVCSVLYTSPHWKKIFSSIAQMFPTVCFLRELQIHQLEKNMSLITPYTEVSKVLKWVHGMREWTYKFPVLKLLKNFQTLIGYHSTSILRLHNKSQIFSPKYMTYRYDCIVHFPWCSIYISTCDQLRSCVLMPGFAWLDSRLSLRACHKQLNKNHSLRCPSKYSISCIQIK